MLQALRTAVYGSDGSFPDIVWDGYVNPSDVVDGKIAPDRAICIDNGDAGVLNADGPDGYKTPSTDKDQYGCSLPKLPGVRLDGKPGEAQQKS
jgi:hypothetical protein